MADISISAVVDAVTVSDVKDVSARDKVLSYIGSASAQANTVALPAHKAGDLVVVFAHRDGSTTNPTVASGYTNITNTTDGTSNSVSVGCRVSDGTLANTGTWTNATSIAAIIVRGTAQGTPTSALVWGTPVPSAAVSATMSYGGITCADQGNSSMVLTFGAHRSATDLTSATLTGMTAATSKADIAAFYATGPQVNSWSTATDGVNASSGWITYTLEIKAYNVRPSVVDSTTVANTITAGHVYVWDETLSVSVSDSAAIAEDVSVLAYWKVLLSIPKDVSTAPNNNFTFREIGYARYISGERFGSGIRVRMHGAGAIDAAYVGLTSTAGDVYDFAVDPTQVYFKGSSSFSFSGEIVTDEVSLNFNGVDSFIVSTHNTTATIYSRDAAAIQSVISYSKAAVNEAATADVTSYSTMYYGFVKEVYIVSPPNPTDINVSNIFDRLVYDTPQYLYDSSVSGNYRAYLLQENVAENLSKFILELSPVISTTDVVLSDVWVGNSAEADPYDFTGDQVQVTFGGNTSVSLLSNKIIQSDSISYNYDRTKKLVIGFSFSATGSPYHAISYNLGYYKLGASSPSATNNIAGSQYTGLPLIRSILKDAIPADVVTISDIGTVSISDVSLGLSVNTYDSITMLETLVDGNLLVINDVLVFDTCAVGEDIALALSTPDVSVFDTCSVVESVTASTSALIADTYDSVVCTEIVVGLVSSPDVSIFDTCSVIESVTLSVDAPVVSVYDSVVVSEQALSFTGHLLLKTETTDPGNTITITEFVGASVDSCVLSTADLVGVAEYVSAVISVVGGYAALVSDSINITEYSVVVVSGLVVSVYDSTVISESTTNNISDLSISVVDLVNVVEYTGCAVYPTYVSVYDATGLAEYVTVQSSQAVLTVFDTVTTSEFIALLVPFYNISVVDQIVVVDTAVVYPSGAPLNAETSETVSVQDLGAAALSDLELSVAEVTLLSEATISEVSALILTVYTSVQCGEYSEVYTEGAIPERFVVAQDSVIVAEVAPIELSGPILSVFDTVILSEQSVGSISISATIEDVVTVNEVVSAVASAIAISCYDTVVISDTVTAGQSDISVAVQDVLSISEFTIASIALAVTVYDDSNITDIIETVNDYSIISTDVVSIADSADAIADGLGIFSFNNAFVQDVGRAYWMVSAGLLILDVDIIVPIITDTLFTPDIVVDVLTPGNDVTHLHPVCHVAVLQPTADVEAKNG